MYKRLCLLFLVTILVSNIYAQTEPAEGARLHYSLIGFSFPADGNATGYMIEIAWGKHTTEKAFEKERIISKGGATNRIIADVPSFGADYTWRAITKTAKGEKKSRLYHFATMPSPFFDSNITRLNVTKSAVAYRDACVFVDCNKALYDMNGKMVWFLPDYLVPEIVVQDLKCTPVGTITYIVGGRMHEITYEGKNLMQIPGEGGGEPNVHHNATRMNNGHYMVVAEERVSWKKEGKDVIIRHTAENSPGFERGPFGTLNEYDEKGKLVWQFFSSEYFLHSDIIQTQGAMRRELQVHMNAFYFDEQHNQIYLGYRNVSRIVKIQYPEGKVLGVFGKLYTDGGVERNLDQDLFCQQHAMTVRDGKLYLFNNNGCSPNPVPRLQIMQESTTAQYGLKTLWEYETDVAVIKDMRSGGGNIIDLPDGSVFGSLSTPYNDIVIVDMDKKVLWSAKSEKFDKASNSWKPLATYRASILPDSTSIHKMVWYGR